MGTANAVKVKLSKREQTVVVPMDMQRRMQMLAKQKKQKNTKRPFMMVEDDDETTECLYLSEDASSKSTQENEYREDSETEVRVNLHGRKIKQPMALPTFEDEEDDEVNALTQSHADSKSKKKKRKKKKKHKKKKKQVQNI